MRTFLLFVLVALTSCGLILRGKQKRCIRATLGKNVYKEIMDKYEEKRADREDFLEFVNKNFPDYGKAISDCIIAEDIATRRKLGKISYGDALEKLGPFVTGQVREIFRNKEAKKEIISTYKEKDAITAVQVCKKYVLNEVACRAVVDTIAKRFPKL